ncbi:MAG: HD domain-containing protein [Planctomycetes bacterium]|nr:HD domain-containing protein [Planctomycetota bacterium]
MTDTKELLARIAALKVRLAEEPDWSGKNPDRAAAQKVQKGADDGAEIDVTLRAANAGEPTPALPATLRLTGRGVRLLRKGRDLLQALRTIADESAFQGAAPHVLAWHREGMAMIEVVLRNVQSMPASVSAQLRMCDGLEVVLIEVEERIGRLAEFLETHTRIDGHVTALADILRRLATKQPVGMPALQGIADAVLADAKADQPLRCIYESPADPSRFAAAHGLTTANVLARVLWDDAAWQQQKSLAVMAALVHDVGMTRVPSEVLLTEGPLDSDQRRLVEKHTMIAAEMLDPLWPGGGWPIEAATCHHERNDGTGYPAGKRDIQLASFVCLLAVCDVYAALCAPRPYRDAFDTRTALTEVLLLAERGYLDPTSVERLLVLSFYPIGSTVELSDGAIGRVIATHSDEVGLTHPDRPIVLLTTDADQRPLTCPTVVDLLERRERSILRSLPSV